MEISDETIKRIQILKDKYAAIGQDLNSYLDGLIYANPLAYWDYIEVDALLSLQKPKTDFPDEKIFIVYHQITELYFCLAEHELKQIAYNGKNISDSGQDLGWNKTLKIEYLIDRLRRINKYFEALTKSFDVMRFGMDKDQFTKFRMSLLSASGFQTASYRRIEIACTDLKYLVHESKRKHLWNAEVHEQLDNIYWKQGAIVEETGEKTLTLKHFEQKYMSHFHELATEFETRNVWKKVQELPESDRKNPKLIKELRELDVNVNINWPLVHYRTAVRYLAKDSGESKGTGGTNWQNYLPPRFQRRIFYPELWSQAEMDEWGKAWVEEVMADGIRTENLRDNI